MGCISADGSKKIGINDSEILVKWDIGLPTEFDFNISKDGMVWTNGTTTRTTPLETIGGISDLLSQVNAVAPAVNATTLNINNTIQIQNGESPVSTNDIVISTSGGVNQILLDANAGTSGYVLTSGGAGSISWSPQTVPTFQQVINSGNIAKNVGDNVSSIILQETETGSLGSQTTITDTSIRCMTFGVGSAVITNCEMKGGDASNAGLGIEAGNIDIVGQKVSIIPTTIAVEGREIGDVYKVSRLYNNTLQMIDGDGTTNYTAVYLDSTNQEVRIESKHTGVDDKANQITSSAVNITDTFNSKSILLSNDDEKITLINGDPEADRNLISLDNINNEVILEKIQTGIDDITTINLSEVSITDRLTSSSGKLEKNTLTLTNATAGTEIKLETTDAINNSIYVKQSDMFGLTQTTITPTQVKVLSNTIQENYIAIEPTQIGISNAGVLDYGNSGDLLTSGGGLGVLSWGGNLADYQPVATLGTALSTVPTITIGDNAGSANTVVIGNNTLPTSNFPLVNIKGKFSINDVLFSGGDGGSPQLGVASYTIPQDALRNSLYTLIISGTVGPTPLNFPTNDTGGKYITIYNAGAQAIRCLCSAVPARNFFGGNNGLGGGSEYAIRGNQVVQFLSAGASGFLVFAQTNPNSNQGGFPYPLQNLIANQRIFSTRITGASITGSFTYTPLAFGTAPTVQLTAEDATGNHTMTLRTNTNTGFTYVSSSGSFPTALHIYAVGT